MIGGPLGRDARVYKLRGVDKDARGGDSGAAVRPTRESQNTQFLELRFRAKLGDEPEVELALV
jgi:hypothetical protein